MEVFLFILGLLVGSFLNVLAMRLPQDQDVLWGRSHCDFCKKPLRWFELVPVSSFIVQRGRCRRCGKKLSLQYPLVELVTAAGFAFLYTHPAYLIIFCACIVIFVSDFKYQIIPDSMVVIFAVGAVLSTGLALPNIVTGIVSALFFYAIWRATRGRGMGFGDVKLAGVLGFFLGFPLIVFAMYGAFLTGAAVGVILMIVGRKTLKSKIAFGPFLLFGLMLSVLFEERLLGLWELLF